MTKQEKFLLLVVLVVSGVGATLYVQNIKSTNSLKEQVQVGVQNNSGVNTDATQLENQAVVSPAPQNINVEGKTNTGSVTTNTSSTRQANVSYSVPEDGTENLAMTVTLTNGTISDISFSMTPTNKESAEYYNKFKNSFPRSQVIGKTIGGVSLSRIGGASLTTNAFNKAISQL
jgi:hypothetical protein